MLENPLVRFQGSTVALASLSAIEIFGSIEQRPPPAIFMIVLVARVDEILGHDVSRHFQSGEITVKLASHSLDLRSSSFLQGRVEASFTLLLLRASVAGKTTGSSKFSRDETAGRLKRAENGSFYRLFIRTGVFASSIVTEVRPPFLADESRFLVEELSVHTRHFLHNLALPFP